MVVKILLLASGGAIGTVSRYAMSGMTHKYIEGAFPYGTLMVNLLGSLIIGLLWGTTEHINISPNVRIFLFIGILGGFTTFSTFSLETMSLIRDGAFRMAIVNILITNVVGILLVFAGYFASRSMLQ